MKKTKAALVVGAMMAVLALTACGGGGGGGSSTPVNVTLSEYKIEPAPVKLVQGKNTLVIKNNGTMTHDFYVKDLNIKVEVGAGQEKKQEVTAGKAGTFEVICTQPGHVDSGMKGTVEVSKA